MAEDLGDGEIESGRLAPSLYYAECVDKLKIKDKTIYVIYQSDNNYVNGLAPSQIEYIEV